MLFASNIWSSLGTNTLIISLPTCSLSIPLTLSSSICLSSLSLTPTLSLSLSLSLSLPLSVSLQVINKTLNPEWKEKFELRMFNGQEGAVLNVSVWDKDYTSRDDFMGRWEMINLSMCYVRFSIERSTCGALFYTLYLCGCKVEIRFLSILLTERFVPDLNSIWTRTRERIKTTVWPSVFYHGQLACQLRTVFGVDLAHSLTSTNFFSLSFSPSPSHSTVWMLTSPSYSTIARTPLTNLCRMEKADFFSFWRSPAWKMMSTVRTRGIPFYCNDPPSRKAMWVGKCHNQNLLSYSLSQSLSLPQSSLSLSSFPYLKEKDWQLPCNPFFFFLTQVAGISMWCMLFVDVVVLTVLEEFSDCHWGCRNSYGQRYKVCCCCCCCCCMFMPSTRFPSSVLVLRFHICMLIICTC